MLSTGLSRSILWAAIMCGCCAPAFAQQSANPGHVDERFRPRPTAPSVGAPIEIPSTPQQSAPSEADKIQFTVTSFDFEGNSVLPLSQLQAIAANYTGHPISLSQVYELADRLTAAYREAGYILVRVIVPAQKIADGHLRLKIVEGFIDQVKIQGDAGGARPFLMAYGRKIARVRPLTAAVLERELLLASDLAGVNVRSVLTPSTTVQGAADLTLVVEPKAVDAYLSVDNRGSKYLGPYQVMGGVYANDAFHTGGRLGLNAVVTPDSGPDLAYGALSFDQPLGTGGMRLFTSVSYTRTRPGSILRTLETKGSALNGDTALSYPFIRSRDFNLIGSLSFAYHDVRSSNFVVDPLFSDHVRSLTANVYMNALDDWGGYSTLMASITQGLDLFGATTSSSPNKSHVGASGVYTRANFEVTHDQPLFDRTSIFLGASGQTSFGEPLLASEQYSLGGLAYDRAFDPSEVTGDSALAGKAELRFDVLEKAAFISAVQLYGFFEGGEVWQARAPGGVRHCIRR